MRTLSYLLTALLFFTSIQEQRTELGESLSEKEYILEYYQKTSSELEREVADLNKAQLHFKPSPQSWSISQCMEHIIATEKMLFQMTKELAEQPENVERREEIKVTDESLIAGMIDRTNKFKAPDELQPSGIYDSPKEALNEFNSQRKDIILFINNYKGDLRNHITDSPTGPVDAYQSFLFIAGHTARHTAQIEEIKKSKEFPGK